MYEELKELVLRLNGGNQALAESWFQQPSPLFDYKTPQNLIEENRAEQLFRMLKSLDHTEKNLKIKLTEEIEKQNV